MRSLVAYALLIAVTAAGSATAAEPKKSLGKFGLWRTFAYEEGGQTVCYMVTTKMVKPTAKAKERTPYLMITHRPVEGSTDVFSYGAGVDLDSKHGAEIGIGKESYELFSVKKNAWAREPMTDHKIAKAIRTSATAVLTGIPAQRRARTVRDRFSLKGAAEAYRAIGKACGVPDYERQAEVKKKKAEKPVAKKPATKKPVAKKKTTSKKAVSKSVETTVKAKKTVKKTK